MNLQNLYQSVVIHHKSQSRTFGQAKNYAGPNILLLIDNWQQFVFNVRMFNELKNVSWSFKQFILLL